MNKLDDYLVPRKHITGNTDLLHIQEVGGYCPLCGVRLLVEKGKRVNKQYQIAHVFPNSPTPTQKRVLRDVELLGENCESFENKIALCKNCHGYYDDHTTLEEYIRILEVKKELLERNSAQNIIASNNIEEEIVEIINDILNVGDEELEDIALNIKVLKIKKKFGNDYTILRRKIERNVSLYYSFIKECFRNIENEGKKKFNMIAIEVRSSYMRTADKSDDKQVIFDTLVNWLSSKTSNHSREACEIIISFFVQDCEVFDEIS